VEKHGIAKKVTHDNTAMCQKVRSVCWITDPIMLTHALIFNTYCLVTVYIDMIL